jgi:hypothetical protein
MKFPIIITILTIILFVNFVMADFDEGRPDGEMDLFYGKGENLRGWINISLDEEPSNSLLKAFQDNITILEFLEKANADYNCTPNPAICGKVLTGVNGGTSKTLSIDAGKTDTLGIKVLGNLSGTNGVTELSFRISSNAQASCFSPLQIDFGDDESVEWYTTKSQNDFSCSKTTGCYKESDQSLEFEITETPYCEKMTLPAIPVFRIGADIIKGTGSEEFEMTVYDEEMWGIGNCRIESFTTSGERTCVVGLNLTEQTDVFVCIQAEDSTDYKIKGENIEPCGFHGLEPEFTADYSIVARGGKFAPLGSLIFDNDEFLNFNDDDITYFLNNYLEENYDNNCVEGCIIPIKFLSGKNQDVTLFNLNFRYDTRSGSLSSNKFYEIDEEQSKINSDYLRLDLVFAELKVPTSTGVKNAVLRLGGDKILEQRIEISTGLLIRDITPKEASVLTPAVFIALLDDSGNLTYEWDFGDGNSKTSITNAVSHTYNNLGEYNLSLTVTKGESKSTKKIIVNVVSSKESINSTIQKYKSDIQKVKSQVNQLPEWLKTQADSELGLEGLENQMNHLENRFEGMVDASDEDYLELMQTLLELQVPYNLKIIRPLQRDDFLMSENSLDTAVLEELGAGTETRTNEEYFNNINIWLIENMKITADATTYTVQYRDGSEQTLFSYYKFFLEPKKQVSDFYFVASGNPLDIKYSEEADSVIVQGVAKAMIYEDLSADEIRIVEFLHPEQADALNLPVFVSPKFNQLPADGWIPPGACGNGVCDEGETSKNCRSDCKPVLRTLLLLAALLFGAFVIYIILQEWYKRHYESHLFRNKNQLWNLINFISISKNQGLSKGEVFDKLKKVGWSGEQLNYAWNKFHGKRTGMWEIPIFKNIEKKQVRRELEKRRRAPGGFGAPSPGPRLSRV